ncbi:MAG: hypothetical protein SH868_06060 [Bythopirellula sp.]|nr:hypothetical protein [Bythopirellula sp.]
MVMGVFLTNGYRCLLCTMVVVLGGIARSEGGVQVTTKAGRTLAGEIDSRSDQDTLWIRITEGNIILTTSLAWSEVLTVELEGKSIEVTELSRNFMEYATVAPATFLTEFEQTPRENLSVVHPLGAFRKSALASIEIEAGLINLDRTVELDGLLVALAVFDTHGVAVPVRGSLSARLIVQRTDQHTGRIGFQEFQRWSVPVVEKNFIDGIAELPLRFRRASPDFDWELCSSAILNVRLGVTGQGNFEASLPVTIREVNPLRDEMQNLLGSRFYRDELTHNTRHDGTRLLHQGYRPSP